MFTLEVNKLKWYHTVQVKCQSHLLHLFSIFHNSKEIKIKNTITEQYFLLKISETWATIFLKTFSLALMKSKKEL